MPALGRYELLRPLARGGMAEVYLARRRVAGVEKRLVIKRLRRDKNRDARFLDMFIREAQLSMTLVQQNIVPVFDFGRIGDHVFIAMEYIEGRDLGSSLSRLRGSGLPPILAAFVAAECCQALDHAHRRKDQVIHRDVTARNVLLSWDGEVKLADFGIAAVVGEVGGMFGTPAYMAPEQANGASVDARADVYALGIVLWESLTGDHVRPSEERGVALAAARSGELPPLPEGLPPALAEVIRRATEVAPERRFATAREMAEALDAFMIVERVREGGQTPAKRLADWLEARWGDERREDAAAEDLPEEGAIVTFLDDGEEGVRGTHTQRSIAETAAEDEGAADEDAAGEDAEPEPEPEPPTRPSASPRLKARAGTLPPPVGRARAGTTPPPPRSSSAHIATPHAGTAPPAAAAAASPARLLLPSDAHAVIDPWESRSEGEGESAAPPTGQRRRWLIGAIPLAIAASAAFLYLASRNEERDERRRAPQPPTPDAQVAILSPTDAPEAPPDAAEPIPDAPEPQPPPPDAPRPPPDARRLLPDAAIVRPPPRPDAGPGSAAVATAPLRPIWINALPWAFFTVDDDPKQHETPAMLKLPVGSHRVTFTNPQLGVSRTVTVVVPAAGEARHVEKMN